MGSPAPEEVSARFEELAALEHEFEDAELETSKSHCLVRSKHAAHFRYL